MIFLCDTCSVLMVIRIAPDMFLDERFDCRTSTLVRDEIFRTQKFKEKYPWRKDFKDKIIALPDQELKVGDFSVVEATINLILDAGAVNQKTKRCFDLGRVDRTLAAIAIAKKWGFCSHDRDLVDFLEQEYDKASLSPLALYNLWLERGVLRYSPEHATVMKNWKTCNERPQPQHETRKFSLLTGQEYQGS